jgi:uncharacterized membrane protein
MVQDVLVALVFAASVIYLVRLFVKSLTAKSSCSTGCGKCNTLDIDKIEKQLKQKGL